MTACFGSCVISEVIIAGPFTSPTTLTTSKATPTAVADNENQKPFTGATVSQASIIAVSVICGLLLLSLCGALAIIFLRKRPTARESVSDSSTESTDDRMSESIEGRGIRSIRSANSYISRFGNRNRMQGIFPARMPVGLGRGVSSRAPDPFRPLNPGNNGFGRGMADVDVPPPNAPQGHPQGHPQVYPQDHLPEGRGMRYEGGGYQRFPQQPPPFPMPQAQNDVPISPRLPAYQEAQAPLRSPRPARGGIDVYAAAQHEDIVSDGSSRLGAPVRRGSRAPQRGDDRMRRQSRHSSARGRNMRR